MHVNNIKVYFLLSSSLFNTLSSAIMMMSMGISISNSNIKYLHIIKHSAGKTRKNYLKKLLSILFFLKKARNQTLAYAKAKVELTLPPNFSVQYLSTFVKICRLRGGKNSTKTRLV